MQTRIIGLIFAVAIIISAALASLSIVTTSYAQKSTNLSKNSIKGALTSPTSYQR